MTEKTLAKKVPYGVFIEKVQSMPELCEFGITKEKLEVEFNSASEQQKHRATVPKDFVCMKLQRGNEWVWVLEDLTCIPDRQSAAYRDANEFGVIIPSENIIGKANRHEIEKAENNRKYFGRVIADDGIFVAQVTNRNTITVHNKDNLQQLCEVGKVHEIAYQNRIGICRNLDTAHQIER